MSDVIDFEAKRDELDVRYHKFCELSNSIRTAVYRHAHRNVNHTSEHVVVLLGYEQVDLIGSVGRIPHQGVEMREREYGDFMFMGVRCIGVPRDSYLEILHRI